MTCSRSAGDAAHEIALNNYISLFLRPSLLSSIRTCML